MRETQDQSVMVDFSGKVPLKKACFLPGGLGWCRQTVAVTDGAVTDFP